VQRVRGSSALALLTLTIALAMPSVAGAWRRPTSGEAQHIRAAALRSLHGRGWRAHVARVSTVRARYRYATASVDNSRTGVGGEMILRRTGSGWHQLFLGTDEFCSAKAPRAVLRDLGFGC
jgi:hypothetical protein